MFKDNILRKYLFGKHTGFDENPNRVWKMTFPATPDYREMELLVRGDDGIVYALLRRIEEIEKRLPAKKS